MASVFVLLEAFNRKEAAALGFFPCATASFLYAKMPFVYVLDNAVVCKVKCAGSEKLTDCTPPVCQETEDAE